MSFQHMIEQCLHSDTADTIAISTKQYQSWQQQATVDALRGTRYGQSFCHHFGIRDARLWHDWDWRRCDRLIKREYIDQQ
jgi:hypothetical protein